MAKTFDFTKSEYLSDWTAKSDYLRLGTNGLQIRRTRVGEDNMIVGVTLESNDAGTAVTGGADATDWDNGEYSYISGVASQKTKVDMGSAGFFLRKLKINLVRQDADETFGTVRVYVDSGSGKKTELLSDSTTEDNVLLFRSYTGSDANVGVYCEVIEIDTTGTSLDADEIRFADVRAYESTYHIPFQIIEHSQHFYSSTLSAATATVSEPVGSSVTFQITMDGKVYYWDTAQWIQVGSDTERQSEFSNTIADVNSNIASLVDASKESKLGIRAILNTTQTVTPAVTDVTLTE